VTVVGAVAPKLRRSEGGRLRRKMGFQKTAVAVLVAVLLPAPAFAQSGTGTMAAAVTDPTAGALPASPLDHDGFSVATAP
jgi:hypothetical protein